MMTYHEAFATPFACAGVAIVITEGMWVAAKRLLRKARSLPRTLASLAEGLTYSFAWWLADGVQGLRHHQGQHCAPAEAGTVTEEPPAPLVLARTAQPSASEITVFDGPFGELRVRPFLEAEHTWSDRGWE
jgi:hypothetical protein